MEFFAQILEADGDRPVITRTYAQYGVFRDRYIYTDTGQKLTLVETWKLVDGKMIKRLDDPDTYRSIIDAGLIALEEGDMVRYVALWEREQSQFLGSVRVAATASNSARIAIPVKAWVP